VVPDTRLLGAGEFAKVLLTGFSVWPRGVTLELAVARRRITSGAVGHRANLLALGGITEELRVGVILADGRIGTTLDPEIRPPLPDTARVTLRRRHGYGGMGGPFVTRTALYLEPLPPEGTMTLVVEWPEEGIAETRVEIDTGAIRAAAADVVELWPGMRESPPREPDRESPDLAVGKGPATSRSGRPTVPTASGAYPPPGPPRPSPERAPRPAPPRVHVLPPARSRRSRPPLPRT